MLTKRKKKKAGRVWRGTVRGEFPLYRISCDVPLFRHCQAKRFLSVSGNGSHSELSLRGGTSPFITVTSDNLPKNTHSFSSAARWQINLRSPVWLYIQGNRIFHQMVTMGSACISWETMTLSILMLYILRGGRDGSVGVATLCGPEGPGIESRWGARFSAPVQAGPGAHPAYCTMGTGSLPGVKRPGRGTDHPPPSSVPRS